MKLSNQKIVQANAGFQQIGAQRLPVRLSFALAQQALKLEAPLKLIEAERKKLVEKHGEKDEKTGRPSIQPNTAAMDAFNKDWTELMAQEAEVDTEPKVKLPEKIPSTCDKCHHNMDRPFEVESSVLVNLAPFVEV